jgi:biopolymer transport protein ExbD
MRALINRDAGEVSSHGIDLAPMLDFVVNLLIFFIITAVFVKESGLTMKRPTGNDPLGAKKSASIQIHESGEIVIGERTVDVRAVRANVERLRAEDVEVGVLVITEEKAPTGVLVAVVDQVRLGGILDVTFATTPAFAKSEVAAP